MAIKKPTVASIAFRDRVVELVLKGRPFNNLRPDKQHVLRGALDEYRLPVNGSPRKRTKDFIWGTSAEGFTKKETRELVTELSDLLDAAFAAAQQEYGSNVAQIQSKQHRGGGKKARKSEQLAAG